MKFLAQSLARKECTARTDRSSCHILMALNVLTLSLVRVLRLMTWPCLYHGS